MELKWTVDSMIRINDSLRFTYFFCRDQNFQYELPTHNCLYFTILFNYPCQLYPCGAVANILLLLWPQSSILYLWATSVDLSSSIRRSLPLPWGSFACLCPYPENKLQHCKYSTSNSPAEQGNMTGLKALAPPEFSITFPFQPLSGSPNLHHSSCALFPLTSLPLLMLLHSFLAFPSASQHKGNPKITLITSSAASCTKTKNGHCWHNVTGHLSTHSYYLD